jgi:hypothetical protein
MHAAAAEHAEVEGTRVAVAARRGAAARPLVVVTVALLPRYDADPTHQHQKSDTTHHT